MVHSRRAAPCKKSCLSHAISYLESKAETLEPEMENQVITSAPGRKAVEIIQPESKGSLREAAACLCCGRRSRMDEDGCGICDECLAPTAPMHVSTRCLQPRALAEKAMAMEFIPANQTCLG